jgi:hypothetical protein
VNILIVAARHDRGRSSWTYAYPELHATEPGFKPIGPDSFLVLERAVFCRLPDFPVHPHADCLLSRACYPICLLSRRAVGRWRGRWSAGGSPGGTSSGGVSGASDGTPSAGSAGAGTSAVSGVTGLGNVGGLNNSGNDPSGAGNAAKATNEPGTNSAGQLTHQDRRPPLEARHGVRRQWNGAQPGRRSPGGRIDGTVTSGPAMQGDDTIREEDA